MNDTRPKMRWTAIDITVDEAAAVAIEHAMNELSALGTEINQLGKPTSDAVTVVGYFNELPDDETIQDEIYHALKDFGFGEASMRSIERREIVEEDWLSEWKKHWKPTLVGRFTISPPWDETPDVAGRVLIRIEPNMAFGTGTHETTRLCLGAIDRLYRAGESFLDIGTGTGILSIAAAKINTSGDIEIYACDTDKNSVLIAIENAARNGVEGAIDFHIGSISDATPTFDFVCANLTLDVISPNLSLILAKTRRVLILSGILATQEAEAVAALKSAGMQRIHTDTAGDWISLTIEV